MVELRPAAVSRFAFMSFLKSCTVFRKASGDSLDPAATTISDTRATVVFSHGCSKPMPKHRSTMHDMRCAIVAPSFATSAQSASVR